jgi:hypothetical protein
MRLRCFSGNQERHGIGGNSLRAASEAQLLSGGGLDIDFVSRKAQRLAHLLHHSRDVCSQPRLLGDQRGVDVPDGIALCLDSRGDLCQKHQTRDAGIGWIAVRKMASDVTQGGRTKQGVADGMEQHIGIGMSEQTFAMGDFHSA